jgi:hypothetical protein
MILFVAVFRVFPSVKGQDSFLVLVQKASGLVEAFPFQECGQIVSLLNTLGEANHYNLFLEDSLKSQAIFLPLVERTLISQKLEKKFCKFLFAKFTTTLIPNHGDLEAHLSTIRRHLKPYLSKKLSARSSKELFGLRAGGSTVAPLINTILGNGFFIDFEIFWEVKQVHADHLKKWLKPF